MEAKLDQQLACHEHHPLNAMFIDIQKAFDAMDRRRCLHILEGIGVELNTLHLIKVFWGQAVLVYCAVGDYWRPHRARRSVNKGVPLSSTFFNIMMDVIVREWIRLMEEDGINTKDVRFIVALFCADDEMMAARDPVIFWFAIIVLTKILTG